MLGSRSFSASAFSESPDGPVGVQGVSATGAVDSVTVTGDAVVSVTGVEATGGVGTTTPMTAAGAGGPLFGGMAFSQESFSSLADGPLDIVVREGAGAILTGLEATGIVGAVVVN